MVHTVSAGGSDCRYLGRFGLVISQSRCAKTKRAASRAEAALWNTQVETVAVNASGHTFNFTNRLAGIKICDSLLPREKQMYRSRITVSATAWFALVLLISSVSPAQRQTESQRERKPKEQAAAVENATPAPKNEDPTFKGMKYRPIGP